MHKKPSDSGQPLVVSEVRVRLAPSPTGPFHVGTARTALFNWLFARQNDGKFVLRIEDTDTARSEKKWEKEIIEGLLWLGLEWDEGPNPPEAGKFQIPNSKFQKVLGQYGPYRQSERTEIYKKYLEKLLADGNAYWCYCSKEDLEAERQAMLAQGLAPKYSGHCRMYADKRGLNADLHGKKPQVIRFKMQEAEVEFKDIIRGKVKFDASLFGDIAIARNLNSPLFNFAVVVDDAEMKITHVIRGEDHISNTPKQILLQRALGFAEPQYAHLPLILSADRSKLSKRFAETSLVDYQKQGYLPDAVINFLALLGWHPKEDREVLSREELIKEFDLRRVQKAGAIFNTEKLDWLQKEHLKNLSSADIEERLEQILTARGTAFDKKILGKVIETEKSRVKNLNEFAELVGFFFELPEYDAELLLRQGGSREKTRSILEEILNILQGVRAKELSRQILGNKLEELTKREGRGAVLWPLRVAVSGLAASPDPLEIMEILGAKETERRIKIAIKKLG
ncbi:MAG: glutamate--tRNA ligase [Patescibacteria group bacterium]